jgi:hypothetical protein
MAKFGTIEWQEEQEALIAAKLVDGLKLNEQDRLFIEMQQQHCERNGLATRFTLKKGN